MKDTRNGRVKMTTQGSGTHCFSCSQNVNMGNTLLEICKWNKKKMPERDFPSLPEFYRLHIDGEHLQPPHQKHKQCSGVLSLISAPWNILMYFPYHTLPNALLKEAALL